ncbi:MAG: M48 family metalloprotease [Deltaproteobacteria bacterium]|jgi:predicted Zn-dependent protease|nr:M48 family metalloprotease [Deltaproteobacteria bacterium]
MQTFGRILHILASVLVIASLVPAKPAHASFFGGVGIKDEVEMGRKFNMLVRAQMPMIDDPEVSMYVRSIVDRLLAALPPQPFKYTSGVIRHNALNAFAVPGGYVYVFSGLIMNFDTESELAGVLAHELAHVTQRHVASRIERGKMLTVGALLAAVAGVAVGGGGAAIFGAVTASQSAMLNYSRIDESEADSQGFQYILKAGYDPQGMVGAFQKLRRKSWMSGGGNIPAYLSTHPDIGDRIVNIASRVETSGVRHHKENNNRCQRVKTLLLARYGDADAVRQTFAQSPAGDCLARMGEGILAARLNRIPDAAQAFDRALQCGPDDSLVLREAGIFHYGRGDQNQAAPLLTRAMNKDPGDYMARFYYARHMDQTGKPQAAHPFYQEVLRQLPDDADVHEFYGRSLGQANMLFPAYLHLAYAAMYGNNRKKTAQFMGQAKGAIRNASEQAQFNRFIERYKERNEIWKEVF